MKKTEEMFTNFINWRVTNDVENINVCVPASPIHRTTGRARSALSPLMRAHRLCTQRVPDNPTARRSKSARDMRQASFPPPAPHRTNEGGADLAGCSYLPILRIGCEYTGRGRKEGRRVSFVASFYHSARALLAAFHSFSSSRQLRPAVAIHLQGAARCQAVLSARLSEDGQNRKAVASI